jgi:SAM-dependent methyltransferase
MNELNVRTATRRAFVSPAQARTAASSETPPMDCDLIAPWYQALEYMCFGKALEHCRLAHLPRLKTQRAILCGEGDGRFLHALLRAHPDTQVDSVDVSRKMVELSRRRIARLPQASLDRTCCHCGDLRSFTPREGGYDLIATHFFLDCLSMEEAARIITRVASWAGPRARWVISEFNQPPGRIARAWTGAILRGLYTGFRIATGLRATRIPNYRPVLAAAGFELEQQQYTWKGLLVSEVWRKRALG